MKKNMKMEINKDQPLDEVVKELKRLGYELTGLAYLFNPKTYVCTNIGGRFTTLKNPPAYCIETTLAELKEMK